MRAVQTFVLCTLLIAVHTYPQYASDKVAASAGVITTSLIKFGGANNVTIPKPEEVLGREVVTSNNFDSTSRTGELASTTPVYTPDSLSISGSETIATMTPTFPEPQSTTVNATSSIGLDVATEPVSRQDLASVLNTTKSTADLIVNISQALKSTLVSTIETPRVEVDSQFPITLVEPVSVPVAVELTTAGPFGIIPDSSPTLKTETSAIEPSTEMPINLEELTSAPVAKIAEPISKVSGTPGSASTSVPDPSISDSSSGAPIIFESTSAPVTARLIISDIYSPLDSRVTESPTVESISSDSTSTPTSPFVSELEFENNSTHVLELVTESSQLNTTLAAVDASTSENPPAAAITEGPSEILVESAQPTVQSQSTILNLPTSSEVRTESSLCLCECNAESVSTSCSEKSVTEQNKDATHSTNLTEEPTSIQNEVLGSEISTQGEQSKVTEALPLPDKIASPIIEFRTAPELTTQTKDDARPEATAAEVYSAVPDPETNASPDSLSAVSTNTSPAVESTSTTPCTIAGNFSSSTNCRRYVSCSVNVTALIRQEHECSEGLAFSSILQRCARDISPCIEDLSPACQIAGSTPDPTSPSAYYWCVPSLLGGFHKYHIQCEANELFTPLIGRCLPENLMAGSSKDSNDDDLPTDRDIVKAEWKQLKKEIKRKAKEEKIRRKMEAKARAETEKLLAKQKKPIKKDDKDDDDEDDD